MDRKENIAYGLGVNAFMKNAKRVPAHDKLLLSFISDCKMGESIPYLRAWLKGWDAANLTDGIEEYIQNQ